MNVFFDTEFTTLNPKREGYPALISIGCVCEDGQEFYAELSDTWQSGNCSQFTLENVVPLLEGGSYRITEMKCAAQLQEWVENLTEGLVIFRSDNPAIDWPWLEQLFQFYGRWPNNLRRRCGSISFEEEQQIFLYQTGLDLYWNNNAAKQHHALTDARSLLFAWCYALGTTCSPNIILSAG